MLQGVYIRRVGDNLQVKAYLDSFLELTDQAFIEKVESSRKVGIVGSHGQLVYLRAMILEAKRRNVEIPLEVEGGVLLSFREA